jgi:hypothetical protein
MKLNNFFISFMLILIMVCIPVSALNETPIIEKVTMHIYGNAYYANGISLPMGTYIIAKDQFGSQIGSYTVRESGKIGKEFGGTSNNFAINVWRNQSDKTNRTLPIFISFYINNATTRDILTFQQNENMQFDIITAYLPPTPEPTSELTIKTPIPSESIISTPITQNSSNITSTDIPIESNEWIPGWSTNDYVMYGLLFTIVCVMGIIIAGIIISYVIDKTSRDNIMNPDGEWKDK